MGGGIPSTPVLTLTFPEYNGSFHAGPCPSTNSRGTAQIPSLCETGTLGIFDIPLAATSAVIFGTFGNSIVPNTAALELHLFSGVPVPGPIAGAGCRVL